MNYKKISWIIAIALTTGMGCKQENNSGSAGNGGTDLSSSAPAAEKKADQGCSISNVAGGAEISCGANHVFIPTSGNQSARVPRLFDGNVNADPTRPGPQVGDYLISATKSSNNLELLTVWIEKENAILQYENGVIVPRDRAIFYDSNDCSGDGVYQTNSDVHSFALGMGDRIVYWDRYYRLGSETVHCYPRSRKEKDGTCTSFSGQISGDFNGYVAKPAAPGVTTVLFRGYKIKVQ